ncbi:MAG: DNA glycosylase [Candidatus Rokuibacteriota bacterium]|nr:MAG: DNA glycosylase [Candidatus Rokubacteria bacterium]
MPEGDTLHRAARRLAVLVGQQVSVEAGHPRAAATGVAERLDGKRLIGVEARGKNLLLRFEGGLVLRSHLRMTGRWRLLAPDAEVAGRPWLVVRGREGVAVLRGGAVLELSDRHVLRLGPDILAEPPAIGQMLTNLRAADPKRELGEALLDQRLVSGIGNVWRAEALWSARLSPWLGLGESTDDELREVLTEAAGLMRASLDGHRPARAVYRRAGRPCPRCGEQIRVGGQGEDNRLAYWCPGCQHLRRGGGPPGA